MNSSPDYKVQDLLQILETALGARRPLLEQHQAIRLFNGFLEGEPRLAADLYAGTLVLHNYADPPASGEPLVDIAQAFYLQHLARIRCVIAKSRKSKEQARRNGVLSFGDSPHRSVREHGVHYALDTQINRDASLYLDTRNLRKWALENLAGKSVLNVFAYTGSLGVAAKAGKAERVVQLDLNRRFLNLAKRSYTLNGFPIDKKDFISGDFFPQISRMKRGGVRCDCVFIDPPFFSTTARGVIDLAKDNARLINKVRPLINNEGILVVVNNAIFHAGSKHHQMLAALCADGYLKIREMIPVPEDFTGYGDTRRGEPVCDPEPYNHSTKITILDVRRKRE